MSLISKIGLTPPSELFKNIAAQAAPVPQPTKPTGSTQVNSNFFSSILQGTPSDQVQVVTAKSRPQVSRQIVDQQFVFSTLSPRDQDVAVVSAEPIQRVPPMPDWLRAAVQQDPNQTVVTTRSEQQTNSVSDRLDTENAPRVVQLFGGQVQAIIR